MINKIRYYCQKILPLVYDDSLSYYEVLCKVTNKLNEVIESNNNLATEWEDFKNNFNTNLFNTVNKILTEWFNDGSIEGLVKANLIENQFAGKTVAFIGDSTVYGDDTTGGQTSVTLPSAFQSMTNCKSLNYGSNGMTVTGKTGNTLYTKLESLNLNNADYIVVLCGYNDWNTAQPISEISGVTNYGNFKNSLYYNLKTIINNAKSSAKIYMCTMLPSGQSVQGIPNKFNVLCESYVNAVCDTCYKLNIPVINLFKSVNINLGNWNELLIDMTHPTSETYKMIAEAMIYAMGSGECWNKIDYTGDNIIGISDFKSKANSLSVNVNTNSFTFSGETQSAISYVNYSLLRGQYTVGAEVYNNDTNKHTLQLKIDGNIVYQTTLLNGKNYIHDMIRLAESYYNKPITILISDMTTQSPSIEINNFYIIKGLVESYNNVGIKKYSGTLLNGKGTVEYNYLKDYVTVNIDYTTTASVTSGNKISNLRCGASSGVKNRQFVEAYDLDTYERYVLEITTDGIITRTNINERRHLVCKSVILL